MANDHNEVTEPNTNGIVIDSHGNVHQRPTISHETTSEFLTGGPINLITPLNVPTISYPSAPEDFEMLEKEDFSHDEKLNHSPSKPSGTAHPLNPNSSDMDKLQSNYDYFIKKDPFLKQNSTKGDQKQLTEGAKLCKLLENGQKLQLEMYENGHKGREMVKICENKN